MVCRDAAIPCGEPELQALLNKALAEMTADGTLATMSQKWFGVDLSPKG
ncbi:MAG: transporter substrate-binding domain-containing protein [Rhizobiales bacterium]|nr:transporter substrate-binding domain-containing protein [Hyphomicrobiales bacterium]